MQRRLPLRSTVSRYDAFLSISLHLDFTGYHLCMLAVTLVYLGFRLVPTRVPGTSKATPLRHSQRSHIPIGQCVLVKPKVGLSLHLSGPLIETSKTQAAVVHRRVLLESGLPLKIGRADGA